MLDETQGETQNEEWMESFDPNDPGHAPDENALAEGAVTALPPDMEQEPASPSADVTDLADDDEANADG